MLGQVDHQGGGYIPVRGVFWRSKVIAAFDDVGRIFVIPGLKTRTIVRKRPPVLTKRKSTIRKVIRILLIMMAGHSLNAE